MWKTKIIKHTNSDGLADRVSSAVNKLQDSPEVVGTISISYAACPTSVPTVQEITMPGMPTQRNTSYHAGIEYSCMLTYRTIKNFDTLANETSNP